MELGSPSQTKEILQKYNLNLKKSLGQNFLVDGNILRNIVGVADITKDDTVVEIGPGIGSLTQQLAKEAGEVIAVELDDRLIPVLEDTLAEYDNVKIKHGDALEVDFDQLAGKNYKVVANLPYYITTPIVMRLLEEDFSVDKIVVMVQKEVAERMVASPEDGKDYGVLSIGVQYHTAANIAFNVPSSVFIPQPRVDSAVVSLTVREESRAEVLDEKFFFKVVRASFQQRRKTIRNALSKAANIDLSRDLVDEALERVGIDSRRRGEKLNIEQFAQLSDLLFKLKYN
ncbi:dimethyladenosine transferase [Halobacteroides halobius DSM 5150]|uniref:Ribosomal RNA small subunit methyltransferase A n=1 Tax=Halobacteroides halobius (strain ATCC 35273 / DSM 5150 / MD-1) TaxID=748449 RepID=L0K506_HALHC|nr:16S rRNA (adenine(1518)-N(6)/adenine(1519)-N(6))-dimethyltransferase RsmA [Halobacteroides halobius]AGB40101.1 dimethyladenosine transferase [Halobacteroides halobius DSM 5150]